MGLYLGELGGGRDSVGEVGKIANEMLMMSSLKHEKSHPLSADGFSFIF